MGVTAENLAVKYNLTREEVDAFAVRSQQTWGAAQEKGVFKDEIAPGNNNWFYASYGLCGLGKTKIDR